MRARTTSRAVVAESYSEIWTRLQAIQRDLQARQILVVGLLDRLYDPGIITRDASRTLGGIKAKLEHLAEVLLAGRADAVLAASIFHFGEYTVRHVKEFLAEKGIPVRI